MWLLRNSGRYQPERYEVLLEWAGWLGLQLEARQYLSAHTPAELAEAVQSGGALPRREHVAQFGEIALAIPTPQEPPTNPWNLPSRLYVWTRVALPIRELKAREPSRFGNPWGVLREFADVLTVATNSYVVSRLPDEPDGDAERRGDRPAYSPGHLRPPIEEGFFDLGSREFYADCLERFMGLHWAQHAALLNAFRCYRLALGLASLSPSTAYFLLVSAVEAVAATFSHAEGTFEEFSDQFRRAFQRWQNDHNVPGEVADDLRAKLADAQKGVLRASRRFRQVVVDYLPDEFWGQHPHGGLEPESLEEHLKAAYSARSKFAHEAKEFGIEVDIPGVAVLPVLEYDTVTGETSETTQRVPTLDFFARIVRAVLLSILEKTDESPPDENVDPEAWLLGRGVLVFPADAIA